jgi:hypothetical protein
VRYTERKSSQENVSCIIRSRKRNSKTMEQTFGRKICKNNARNASSIVIGVRKLWRACSYTMSFISIYVSENYCLPKRSRKKVCHENVFRFNMVKVLL